MATALNPTQIHPPFAPYSHGIVVPAGQRLVFCSGQLGIARRQDTSRPIAPGRRASVLTISQPFWPRPA